MSGGDGINWVPLESNPDVLNEFLPKIGVPKDWKVVDVLGLDDELLAMLPKDVIGLILLYPLKKEDLTTEETTPSSEEETNKKEDVFFMKQTITNACGTIALLHVVGNNQQKIQLIPDSALFKFFSKTSGNDVTAEERGKVLESTGDISEAHALTASEGQTAVPSQPVIHHFVAFVNAKGKLYELDGRKAGPILHGDTTDASFIKDAATVCKKRMALDPEEQRFSLIALAKVED